VRVPPPKPAQIAAHLTTDDSSQARRLAQDSHDLAHSRQHQRAGNIRRPLAIRLVTHVRQQHTSIAKQLPHSRCRILYVHPLNPIKKAAPNVQPNKIAENTVI